MTATLESLEQVDTVLHEFDLQGPYKKIEVIGGNIVTSPLRAMHGGTIFALQTQLAAQLPEEYWFVYDVLTPELELPYPIVIETADLPVDPKD